MIPKKLFWKLYIHHIFIALLITMSFFFVARYSFSDFYYSETAQGLESRLRLIEPEIKNLILEEEFDLLQDWIYARGKISGTRLTIVSKEGKVLAESSFNPSAMENHKDRPEVIEALAGKAGALSRESKTLNEKHFYVAIPIKNADQIIAVARASLNDSVLQSSLFGLNLQILSAGILIIFLVAFTTIFLSKKISRPLEEMRYQSNRFANKDLSGRIGITEDQPKEVQILGKSLNRMADQLDKKIKSVEQQKKNQEAVLSSMIEGVLSLDNNGHVLQINQTGMEILHLNSEETVIGQNIDNIIADPSLLSSILDGVRQDEIFEDELSIENQGRHHYIDIRVTSLKNSLGERIGSLIVLNDITRLKKLEKYRKHFVANVSHELRTPLTSIKGFVETLIDGALENREDAQRFLGIILRQVDRLYTLIESLLALSKMDQDEISEKGHKDLEKIELEVKPLLDSAVQICEQKARNKNIQLSVQGSEGVKCVLNPSLLEQALVSLVDNAISYSEEGKPVTLKVKKEENECQFIVSDHGPGIPEKHQSLIFQRFYRIDKGRSRYRGKGGTGLGLAIVKHIARAHGGKVYVKSEVGSGSDFVICLPS